ncbi:MAG: LytTR family transcriptional regulator DNA-binding domain-containing protein [Lachnospiraceae bacterium]|nr:LytTR family transcriptional regulator DNA-binding domain-containing protein [Lachnospiraceae bacterium]MBO7340098.1 LytTR family transcriptional regulator DNA-binding domain-containing protein [Lachnospiraceae bacterium]MBP5263132.1 LytTR family transcriptional regulator DNA-binding domain-containing protein [Lachnospiraceae bacterium]MBP5669039.1 LytTR family transcriptional regulator DNA-binding domain-containing protein [Lachnospiraceae bacterium]MBP5733429.1 LytTR family transcriptional
MRIIFESPKDFEEDTIIVRCVSPDPRLVSILRSFETAQDGIVAFQDDKIVRIQYQDIFYFESIDEHIFAYCTTDVYEVKKKLFELEELLSPLDFVRCSKSLVVNMEKIDYLSPLFSGKLEAHLKNGEKLVISRKYVQNLRAKLGVQEED